MFHPPTKNPKSMSELALQLIREAKTKKFKSLNLGSCGLTELPMELFELVWLEELVVSNEEQWIEGKKGVAPPNSGKPNFLAEIPNEIRVLKHLKKLDFGYNQISNIKPLEELTQLIWLDFNNNKVKDISPLSNLINLSYLVLWKNQVGDIKPLSKLQKLNYLNLGGNKIDDITPLESLSRLGKLLFWGNQINDITPLENLTLLSYVNFRSNQVNDITPIRNLL